ncbi:MAG: flagellar protein FlgN [Oscillospiraceae bacterium]|nr:flagellar protein FlgN [Oscillospiraceae bacterium]MCL2278276.1 flagellar protein FlgN [Oscillospiraceae bacterium]
MSDIVLSGEGKLLKLLGEERVLLEQMKKLTDEQARHIEKDEFEELGKLLDKRQELIEKINGLHQESAPLMQSCVSSSDYEMVVKIDELKSKIKQILAECNDQNNRNVEELRHKSQDYAERIETQSSKRKVIGGYAQAVPNSSEKFDKKT